MRSSFFIFISFFACPAGPLVMAEAKHFARDFHFLTFLTFFVEG